MGMGPVGLDELGKLRQDEDRAVVWPAARDRANFEAGKPASPFRHDPMPAFRATRATQFVERLQQARLLVDGRAVTTTLSLFRILLDTHRRQDVLPPVPDVGSGQDHLRSSIVEVIDRKVGPETIRTVSLI